MNSYSEELKEILLSQVPNSSVVSGGEFILTKCIFCGDGKHHDSRHLYINLGTNSQIPWCYCHICNNTAKVTSEFLSTYFNIYNVEFLTKTSLYVNKVYKNNKYKTYDDENKIYNINNSFISDNDLSRIKLKRINKRLGTNLDYSDLSNLKIVLNLKDLLNSNSINKLTRAPYIVDELNISFLGFISTDNAFVTMRNLKKYNDIKALNKRYINYNIFDKGNNTQRFYIIPNSINLNNPERIKIHISEGPFDILSIYLNLRKELHHNIYASVNGSGYLNIIKHFINRLKLINIEFHIYKDNDMDDYILKKIANMLVPYNIPFYIHHNDMKGEKDFGVSLERISEIVERVL